MDYFPNSPWRVDARTGGTTTYLERTHISTYLTQLPMIKKRKRRFVRERLPSAFEYYVVQFPRLRLKGGKETGWVSERCCFHKDTIPSLRIHLRTGAFRCFGCGAKGGDVLAFVQQRYRMTFEEAVNFFDAWGEV